MHIKEEVKNNIKYKRHFRILRDAVHAMNAKLDPKQVMETIMGYIGKLMPSDGWSILLKEETSGQLVFEMACGLVGSKLTSQKLSLENSIAGWVAKTGKPVMIKNAKKDRRFNASFDKCTQFLTRTVLCAPIISRGKILGSVEIINKKGKNKSFTKEDLTLLQSLLEPAGIALENAFLFKKVQQLVVTDDLTQLYNYRYIHDYLEAEIKKISRSNSRKKISLIFLDLDGFKEVDDHYGHIVGGKALKIIGTRIKNAVDQDAIVSRYGGDEFAIILPDTDEPEAVKIAEHIRNEISETNFRSSLGVDTKVTASIGIAVYPE
ncbi:MAG: hypothetical protein A2Y62_19120, partial [Candidatus Fischerbacteria bacterium RBG_13_37_8]